MIYDFELTSHKIFYDLFFFNIYLKFTPFDNLEKKKLSLLDHFAFFSQVNLDKVLCPTKITLGLYIEGKKSILSHFKFLTLPRYFATPTNPS